MSKHLHFLGIGGISMSGLARYYSAKGYQVSGCDIKESNTILELLKEGINVQIGHSVDHLEGIDRLVYNKAISDNEAELKTAIENDIERIGRLELLAELFTNHKTIGITGSHGKSTITAMVAVIFLALKQDPSIQIGAELAEISGNWRYGNSKYLIAEVDESNPAFANLKTDAAIIANLGYDHIAGEFDERRNYYASKADLNNAVKQYISKTNKLIYYADCPNLEKLIDTKSKNYFSYGYSELADYRILNEELCSGSSLFQLKLRNGNTVAVKLNVPGAHNVQNASAALALAELYGLDINKAVKALEKFHGVGRRWQIWGKVKGALIIDDYAVHQTEIKATLKTAKNTKKRVRAVLQPHRMVRTAQNWQELAKAVSVADEIIVLDIYNFGEKEIPGISSQLIIDYLQNKNKKVSHHDINSAARYLFSSLESNDLIITLGAGDVWRIAEKLIAFSKLKDNQNIVELKDYCSLKVGGTAELWEVNNIEELKQAVQKEFRIIGAGSNLLISDKGVDERVIKLGKGFNNLNTWQGENDFWFSAATPLPGLVRKASKFNLSGVEGLLGIPAQLGGAIKMNAGTRFGEISDCLKEIEVFHEGQLKILSASELGLSYRHSDLAKNAVITRARLVLNKAAKSKIQQKLAKVDAARKNQPKKKSAGCAFKNPSYASAGKIIDDAGLKGLQIGDAMVTYEHANFIVNLGNAKSADITALLQKINDSLDKNLEVEWEMWGF